MTRAGRGRGGGAKHKHPTPWEPSPEHMEWFSLYSKGEHSHRDIAEKVGVTRQAVSHAIKEISKWLVPKFMDGIREIRSQHTEHLMHIFHEAMRAWSKSKEVEVVEMDRVSNDDNVHQITKKQPTGNAGYLTEARAALAEIRKIWGADAPQQIEVAEGRVAGLSREQAVKNRIEYLQELVKPSEN